MKKIYILSLLVLPIYFLAGQNLLNNPSFEEHIFSDEYLQINYFTKNWIFSPANFICNCEGKKNRKECKNNIFLDKCNYLGIRSWVNKDNKYNKNRINQTHTHGGFTSKLNKPLELSKIYEVKFWIYVPSGQMIDAAYLGHIGFKFTKSFDFLRDYHNFNWKYSNWKFNVNKIEFDKWLEVKRYLRPTCDSLYYFTFGIFTDKYWPQKEVEDISIYYLDNFSILEKSENFVDSLKIIPTIYQCPQNREESTNSFSNLDSISIFYDSNKSSIKDSFKVMIDSFITRANNNKLTVFEINGYTDFNGNNHFKLAKSRVDSIIQYLNLKYKINNQRIIANYLGNVNKSKQEEIMTKNRRVDIKISNLSVDKIFYQKAISAINIDSTFLYLKKWLILVNDKVKIYSIFDTRLDKIKNTEKWTKFIDEIRKTYYSKIKFKEAFELDSMYVSDQKYKTTEAIIQELAGTYKSNDSLGFSFPIATIAEERQHDSINYVWMTKYIEKNGWPNQSEVGERPSRAAFYIIDHHLDTNSLKKYVPILESKCREGEANWSDYATMFDRKEKESGRPQLYCTQYMQDPTKPNRIILSPYDSKKAVNERRKKLGLTIIRDFNISFLIKE